MVESGVSASESRLTSSGDEAGTAPGDRKWRPDIQGLRAIAVALVVAVHFGVPGFQGGYVGVDVFFVVSGFVIAGLLLRESNLTGRTSLVDFYARRCRRILPMATVVIVTTVVASYLLLGQRFGNNAAREGIWAAAFAFNFHHFVSDWNPLPPFANYWSLAVEEQFYLVFPLLFLALFKLKKGVGARTRLAVGLCVVIGASFSLSIIQSSSNQAWAFLSPLTRAWELALGALLALSTPYLLQTKEALAATLTWVGLLAIAGSVFTFPVFTDDYPGWRVAIPVLGTALIIGGGTANPVFGVERLIGTSGFGWLGARSYTMYLWHWPVLIVASEVAASANVLKVKLPAIAIALLLTVLTYRIIEQPGRHLSMPSGKTVVLGLSLVAGTVLVLLLLIAAHP